MVGEEATNKKINNAAVTDVQPANATAASDAVVATTKNDVAPDVATAASAVEAKVAADTVEAVVSDAPATKARGSRGKRAGKGTKDDAPTAEATSGTVAEVSDKRTPSRSTLRRQAKRAAQAATNTTATPTSAAEKGSRNTDVGSAADVSNVKLSRSTLRRQAKRAARVDNDDDVGSASANHPIVDQLNKKLDSGSKPTKNNVSAIKASSEKEITPKQKSTSADFIASVVGSKDATLLSAHYDSIIAQIDIQIAQGMLPQPTSKGGRRSNPTSIELLKDARDLMVVEKSQALSRWERTCAKLNALGSNPTPTVTDAGGRQKKDGARAAPKTGGRK